MNDLPNTEAEAIKDGARGCLLVLALLGSWALVLYAIYRLVIAAMKLRLE